MPNFDALRTGNLGPLAYLCKPQPPAELLGCWPLTSTSDKADLSRYGNNYSGTLSAASQTNALAKVIMQTNATFPCVLDLGKPFSIDFFVGVSHGAGAGSLSGFSLGNLNFTLDSSSNSGAHPDGFSYGGSTLATGAAKIQAAGSHVAITYDGTTLRRFINGVLNLSATVTMTGTANGFSCYQNSVWCFGNMRIVQKCLGTTSYSVPSAYYTGYDPLNGGGVTPKRFSKIFPERRHIAPVAVMGGRA